MSEYKLKTFTGSAAILIFAAAIAAVLLSFLVGGWLVMLLLGALHHSVWASIPALGYWPSFIIYAALSFIAGLFKRSN